MTHGYRPPAGGWSQPDQPRYTGDGTTGYPSGGYPSTGYPSGQYPARSRRADSRRSRRSGHGSGRRTRGPAKPPKTPGHRGWTVALSVLAVLVLIAICGSGAYFVLVDERQGSAGAGRTAAKSPEPSPRDISSQAKDPTPLTEKEVFPTRTIPVDPNRKPYQVVKTQLLKDCRSAATDQLVKVLADAGCTQVVRATMKSPTGAYIVTAGVFNLRDEDAALQVHDAVKPTIDAKKGRFTGFAAGSGTDVIARSATELGWDTRGHFLVYCVIARADGKTFGSADQQATRQIIADLVTSYLLGTVIENRTVPVTASATPSPAG